MSRDRYPENWQEIATSVKESASWRCQKCGKQCLQPHEKNNGLSVSERRAMTLNVHHRNFRPEDNRLENLVAVCTGCHLEYHQNSRGNVPPGQLELW